MFGAYILLRTSTIAMAFNQTSRSLIIRQVYARQRTLANPSTLARTLSIIICGVHKKRAAKAALDVLGEDASKALPRCLTLPRIAIAK